LLFEQLRPSCAFFPGFRCFNINDVHIDAKPPFLRCWEYMNLELIHHLSYIHINASTLLGSTGPIASNRHLITRLENSVTSQHNTMALVEQRDCPVATCHISTRHNVLLSKLILPSPRLSILKCLTNIPRTVEYRWLHQNNALSRWIIYDHG
jgi:hypothetical protein